jgi:hypothetical protein
MTPGRTNVLTLVLASCQPVIESDFIKRRSDIVAFMMIRMIIQVWVFEPVCGATRFGAVCVATPFGLWFVPVCGFKPIPVIVQG